MKTVTPSSKLGIKKRICNDDLRRANERAAKYLDAEILTEDEVTGLIGIEAAAVDAINGICDSAAKRLADDA